VTSQKGAKGQIGDARRKVDDFGKYNKGEGLCERVKSKKKSMQNQKKRRTIKKGIEGFRIRREHQSYISQHRRGRGVRGKGGDSSERHAESKGPQTSQRWKSP